MSEAKPFEIPRMLIWEAWQSVRANRGAAGVDEESIQDFERNLKDNLFKVWNRMASGCYFPPPVKRRFWNLWWSRTSTRTPTATGAASLRCKWMRRNHPAVPSDNAAKEIRQTMRQWKLDRQTVKSLGDLASWCNPRLRGIATRQPQLFAPWQLGTKVAQG